MSFKRRPFKPNRILFNLGYPVADAYANAGAKAEWEAKERKRQLRYYWRKLKKLFNRGATR